MWPEEGAEGQVGEAAVGEEAGRLPETEPRGEASGAQRAHQGCGGIPGLHNYAGAGSQPTFGSLELCSFEKVIYSLTLVASSVTGDDIDIHSHSRLDVD